jgi:MFS family permease
MTALRPIALQVRLDAARTINKSSVLSAFILPLAMSFVSSLFMKPDFAFGISLALFSMESLTLGLAAPLSEGVNDHRNINGIVPINRAHQVMGRYLFLLASLVGAVIGIAACWLFAEFVAHRPWSISLGIACITVAIFALIAAIVVFPFFYAWNPEKIMQAFAIVVGAIFLGFGALASLMPESWATALDSALTWLFSHPWITTGSGIVICILAVCTSIALSIHLLKRRQY